jgi:hypothetical protein
MPFKSLCYYIYTIYLLYNYQKRTESRRNFVEQNEIIVHILLNILKNSFILQFKYVL